MERRLSDLKDSRQVGWGLLDMLFAGLTTLALLGAGTLALVVGMLLWSGLNASSLLSTEVLLPAVFASEAALILPAWLWGPRKYGGGWASLGLRGFALGKAIALILLGLAGILLINVGWETIRQLLSWPGQPDYLPVFGEGVQGLLIALVLGSVVAPTAEEVLFRGYLYAGLRERWGVATAVLLSSLLFSLVHGILGVVPPIFVMGAILALIYERTESLWPSIALHGAVNALAFLAAYLSQHVPDLLPGMM